MKDNQKVIAGVAVLALVAIFLIAGGVGGGGGKGGGGGGATACALTASGVGLIADGLTRHESAGSILTSLGASTAAGVACKEAVETLANNQATPVPLTIRAGGVTVDREATGAEIARPTSLQASQLADRLACTKYTVSFIVKLCVEGRVSVPSG
jgi:hypothetical protein